MSKNLRGYSSAMQNVNLRDIVADSVTATNGTFTTLNMATFNITQQLAVNNLINSGVLRLTGITNNTSTEDMKILVRSTTDNNVYELTNFTMNASTGLLSAGALKLTSLLTLPSGTASSNSRLLFRHWSGNVYMSEGVEWNEVTDTLTVAKLKITSITTPVASANHPILIIDKSNTRQFYL